MATLEEIVVQLTAETSQLKAELSGATKAVQTSTDKMEKALKEFSDNSKKSVSFTQQALATFSGFLGSQAVLGAINALKSAAGSAFGALADGMKAAQAEEAALTRLANSMQLAGTYSKEAASDIKNFTGEMERVTGIGDDVVASNLAVLSSMTKLSADGLKQAQQAAIDLSSAYGIDLDAATKAVGKAINGNVSGLQKLGVEIAVSSDKTQQFSNVMQGLAGVQGSAAANARTFAGSLLSVQNSFGNFVEEIGKAVTGNSVLIAALGEVSKIFDELTGSAEGNGEALRVGIANAFIFIADAAVIALRAVDIFLRALNAGVQAVLIPVFALIDSMKFLANVITMDFQAAKNSFDGTKGAAQDLMKTLDEQTAIGDIADQIARVRDAGAGAFDQLSESAASAAPSVKAAASATKELTEAQKAHNEVLKSFAEGLAQQTQALNSELEFRRQMIEMAAQAEQITAVEAADMKLALLQEQLTRENEALETARAKGLITEQTYQDALAALTQQNILRSQQAVIERQKAEEAANKQRVENLKSTFGTISSLASSSSKELAAIGKAAAITNATIDGIAAVQKALASAPPPVNFALAAAVGAATAANVAKIAGVGLQRGIDSVPGIGNQDNFPAVLAPGERVVPSQTNQDLTEFLRKQSEAQSAPQININVVVQPGTGVNEEGAAAIVDALNNYFARGGLKLMGAT